MGLCTNAISSRVLGCKRWCASRCAVIVCMLMFVSHAQVDKYEQGIFGACPRVYCNGTHVVPCGRTDLPGLDTVKLFCPNCNDIYTPPSSRFQGVDGALSHASQTYIELYRTDAGYY